MTVEGTKGTEEGTEGTEEGTEGTNGRRHGKGEEGEESTRSMIDD